MVRKQVYLEPQQERRLKQTARALGVSEAELIRRGVSQVADVGAPGLVDPEAWVRELASIRKRARRHKRRGGMRSWTREGLYEERLSRLPH